MDINNASSAPIMGVKKNVNPASRMPIPAGTIKIRVLASDKTKYTEYTLRIFGVERLGIIDSISITNEADPIFTDKKYNGSCVSVLSFLEVESRKSNFVIS
nr:hypothetical protein [Marinobacter halodurans]